MASYEKIGLHGSHCSVCDRALPPIPVRRYTEKPFYRKYTVRRTCQCCRAINQIEVNANFGLNDSSFVYTVVGYK